MADAIEGMPEFGKPEEIPLVVPVPPEEPDPAAPTPHPAYMCSGLKKDGTLCRFVHQKNRPFCVIHDPLISDETRLAWKKKPRKPRLLPMGRGRAGQHVYKSREEILAILSKRLDIWMNQYGTVINPDVDEAICNLARTYAHVAKVEISEGSTVRGWRMKA